MPTTLAFLSLAGACGLDVTGKLAAIDVPGASSDGGNAGDGRDEPSSDGSSADVAIPPDSGGPDTGSGDGGTKDVDVDGCPSTCNGGCGADGGVCTIQITTYSTATIDCPPALACRIECTGGQVCAQPINCAANRACTLVCNGNEACKSTTTLNQNDASTACLVCIGDGGSTGCDEMVCNAAACTRVCDGNGCGSSCGSCTTASACP